MTCERCVEQLNAYVDNELGAEDAAAMQEHLRTCGDCAHAHRVLLNTRSLVKERLVRYEAPDMMKARIRAELAGTRSVLLKATPRSMTSWSSRWPARAAALLVVAFASSALTLLATNRPSPSSVADEVVASHIRSLMPGHLTDVASTDQHNVKPWFNGRVNMSPDVPRLDSLGYPLVGGRLDYIDGHAAASVVYARRQHLINVFSWAAPGAADLSPRSSTENGYHVIEMRHNGVESWIVSDLNTTELNDFARRFAGSSR